MNHHVEIHPSDIGNTKIVRCEPCGESLGEEDARDRTNSYSYQEQQTHHQVSASTSAHKGIQPPLSNHTNGDGNSRVLFNSYTGERPINGDAEADAMELEGGGEISIAF